jgi:hypothetical protein
MGRPHAAEGRTAMKEDRREDERPERTPEPAPTSRVRPGNFFRAAVVGALATLAPVAGCYESDPGYGVPVDAADSDASDDAARDTLDAPADYPVPYGVPEYGVADYGEPIYSAPTPR